MRTLTAIITATIGLGAIAGCGATTDANTTSAARAADALRPERSASGLAKSLEARGHKVSTIKCVDVSAKRQRCHGTVDGQAHAWRVDIDLATRTRDFVVTR